VILILQTSKPDYRLRSYADFVARLPRHHADVRIYGPMYEGWTGGEPHIIPHFHPGWTVDQVIDRYLGGQQPAAIFLFSSSSLAKYGHTDFTRFGCPLFLLFTDAVSWDDERLAALKLHRLKPFRAVFHNYLYKLDQLQAAVEAEAFVHYPCWAAHCYDSEEHPADKDLEFLVSGVPAGGEYLHRDLFARALKVIDAEGRLPGLSAESRLGPRINEADDNERFRRDLLRSKYSPHDGGINGRLVPRYPESCFARSVILSPNLGEEMRAGGYRSGENCLLFDRAEYATPEATLRLLNNVRARPDRGALAEGAYELARTRHCTDVRIRAFLERAL
jgi:hypothetical protein